MKMDISIKINNIQQKNMEFIVMLSPIKNPEVEIYVGNTKEDEKGKFFLHITVI